MTSPNSNPRITTFISTTKDENNLLKIIAQVKQMQNPTLHYILCKYIECNLIKDEPEFLDIIFKNHSQLIIQMIEWMLIPKFIAKKKKIKSNVDFFPFRCKQFMRDNISFYQKLYFYARNNKNLINCLFNFLKKQYYDKDTILTALGYFGQVFIPFAKYQFSISHQNEWQPNSHKNIQVLSLSQELRSSDREKGEIINIMKILPKQQIQQLIQYTHYQPVFQFLKTTILVSIQDPTDYQISKNTLLKILLKSQTSNICFKLTKAIDDEQDSSMCEEQIYNKIELLQNVSYCLKELISNIQPTNDMQLRIQSFIYVIVQSKIIHYAIDQILLSKFCVSRSSSSAISEQVSSPKYSSNASFLSLSQQLPRNTNSTTGLGNLTLHHGYSTGHRNQKGNNQGGQSSNIINEYDQQDLIEILLRILVCSAEIFVKIPKTMPNFVKKQEYSQQQLNNYDKKLTQNLTYQNRGSRYKKFVNIFRQQMQYLINNMNSAVRIVYNKQEQLINTKTILFSSGQKIKTISLMKFEFLKLINNILMIIRSNNNQNINMSFDKDKQKQRTGLMMMKKLGSVNYAPFQINFQKLSLIPIIEKYLSQNRWNNIVHHLMQKICHSLIICGYDYIRKNVQKDKNKKLTQSFLAFLVQNFTQRDYIFLNTLKFTSQGNLHSIYTISKDLAFTLNSTNKLIVLLNEFEPWKKFIMNDLKIYEEKTYPKGVKPNDQDDEQQQTYIKVDEAESIKRLVEDISNVKKWPNKITKSKGASKSGIIGYSYKDVSNKDNDQAISMTKSYGGHFQSNKKNSFKKSGIGLQELCRKKIDQSIQHVTQLEIEEGNISPVFINSKPLSKSQIRIFSQTKTQKQEDLDKDKDKKEDKINEKNFQQVKQLEFIFKSYASKSSSQSQNKIDGN